MAVAFRAASEDSRGTSGICVPTPPSGTTSGDLLLAVQCSDKRGTLAEMTAPADWTEIATNSDRASDVGFVKVWQKTATSSEPASYSFPDSTSAHSDVVIVALSGYDTTAPLLVTPTWNNGATQTTHAALSVTGTAGDVLLTAHIAGTNGTTRSYTAPSGMTLAQDTTVSSGGYILLGVYYLALTSAGATDSKIATCSASTPFVAMSLVVQDPGPKTVSAAGGIGTGEAFGSPTVTVAAGAQTVSAAGGIGSAEALGAPVVTVAAAAQTVAPVGIASGEAFGAAIVIPGQVVSPAGIDTGEAVGVPSVSVPDPAAGPYPSATLFPGATLYPGAAPPGALDQTITPAGIGTAEAVGVPVVAAALGPQTVVPTGIDTGEAFGVPTVAPDAPATVVDLTAAGIPSGEALGRPFVFVEVPPPVVAPVYVDTYFVDGVDLSSYAWNIETSEALLATPGTVGDDIVLPGRDGAVEVFAGLGQQRRPDALGRITFNLWLVGVDPSTGNVSAGGTASDWFARWDELVRLFHRRRVTIDHPRPDGSIRRATAYLLPGESMTPSLAASSPWFGRFKATFAISGAHWTDTATVTTGQQSLTTGGTLSLSAFAAATAPCTELTVTFGAGSNPRLTTSWGFVGWNGVISSGRQLGIDTATGTTNQAAGSAWTPGYEGLTYSPGPRLFEIDPSEALSATLTHTGGGSMTVEVAGKRRYRTS